MALLRGGYLIGRKVELVEPVEPVRKEGDGREKRGVRPLFFPAREQRDKCGDVSA